jgi:anti-sigma factor ChrR (cupin superfamily)
MVDDSERLAMEFVLGLLEGEVRASAISRRATDRQFRQRVAVWQSALAPLAESLPASEPPPGLFGDILDRIHATEAQPGKALPRKTLPGTITVRALEGGWTEISKGIEVKVLSSNIKLQRQSVLVRMAPGSVYDSHDHPGEEECLVLDGDLSFNGFHLTKGDYHLANSDTIHPPASTRGGCLLYVSMAM